MTKKNGIIIFYDYSTADDIFGEDPDLFLLHLASLLIYRATRLGAVLLCVQCVWVWSYFG